MLSPLQKQAVQAIINIFETGQPRGDYCKVTLLPGDTGRLTYGCSQVTLASGGLHKLIRNYCGAKDAALGKAFVPYLNRLKNLDRSLDHDESLRQFLQEAGNDPVMQREQDALFDQHYWKPTVRTAEALGARTALGTAVIYDSRIQGSWGTMRHRTDARFGSLEAIGEQAWFKYYVATRRDWLAHHRNRLLNRAVYRMDALRQLMNEDRWDLALPFRVRGVTVDDESLSRPADRLLGAGKSGLLQRQQPAMRGADVRAVQTALRTAGFQVEADGVFGPQTVAAVQAFQAFKGLRVDGIVGPATRQALGLTDGA